MTARLAPAANVGTPLSAANARSDFNIGYCGYRFNGDIGAYTVRFRHYDPTPGMCRWLERDPAGYQDGPSLYSYLGRNPMAGTDPYGLSFWDDFKEGLGYFFGDDFDAKEAERKLRDAQRLLEERLREQVERGIISTDAQLSMVEKMEQDISAAAAQMHEIEAQQAEMVRDTAIAIGVTVATGGVAAVGVRGLAAGAGSIVTRIGAAGRMGRIGSFFYNSQRFSTVSRAYWAAHGPARGASLHHWLIPQRATWIPQGLRNAGFNLLRLPAMKGVFHQTLGLNQWMGFAARWGGTRAVAAQTVENLIRLGIPAGGAAWGYGWYRVGNSASPWSR